jgi:hypothetical protein
MLDGGALIRLPRLDQPADLFERAALVLSQGDQGQLLEVAVVVNAASRRRTHGRRQHAGALVEPQRRQREPGQAGDLGDPVTPSRCFGSAHERHRKRATRLQCQVDSGR